MSELKTPLNEWHKKAGAKMAPFAGWDMPIQYSGIVQEHLHTRENASIFDICHMGEILVSGPGAADKLSLALSTNLATLKPARCRYGFLLTDEGGILDDLITYYLAEDKYLLVVNASRRQADYELLRKRLPAEINVEDISDSVAKIDLQGPKAREVLQALLPGPWTELPYFAFAEGEFKGEQMLISRTGYTGEFGYEIYVCASRALEMWELLLQSDLVRPAGLGARDTLRLEAGLPLNGQDIGPDRTPAEAGYAGMLTSEADYAGKAGAFKAEALLTGLSIPGRRSARHGHMVTLEDGSEVGVVTSASFSPTLGHAIALAYIRKDAAEKEKFLIQADRATLEASKTTLPFYTGSARKKIG